MYGEMRGALDQYNPRIAAIANEYSAYPLRTKCWQAASIYGLSNRGEPCKNASTMPALAFFVRSGQADVWIDGSVGQAGVFASFYASSRDNPLYATYLHFHSTAVYVDNHGYGFHGISLRCLAIE